MSTTFRLATFVLGLRAVWNEPEHGDYVIPSPDVKERTDNLERGLG